VNMSLLVMPKQSHPTDLTLKMQQMQLKNM